MTATHAGLTSYWIFSNALSDISNKIDISEENMINLERSIDKFWDLWYSIFLYFKLPIVFYVLFVVENIAKHLHLVGR